MNKCVSDAPRRWRKAKSQAMGEVLGVSWTLDMIIPGPTTPASEPRSITRHWFLMWRAATQQKKESVWATTGMAVALRHR
jgi:hypothetical protein